MSTARAAFNMQRLRPSVESSYHMLIFLNHSSSHMFDAFFPTERIDIVDKFLLLNKAEESYLLWERIPKLEISFFPFTLLSIPS